MQLKTIIKLGTIVSVLLFVLAVGFYAFMRLDMAERNREVNLFSLVPSDCAGVLESDHINTILNDQSSLNYHRELDGLQFPGSFSFLLKELVEYTSESAHGMSSQMDRLLVSFHHPVNSSNQVIYFRMGASDEQMLANVLQEYAFGHFMPKEEIYRDKSIYVYPLSNDEFIASYTEDGFFVVSYQKRLIEKVIDAYLDGTSLNDDAVFSQLIKKKKSQNFLTLYGRDQSVPFLDIGPEGWNAFDVHMNSDVVYLTGETYVPETEPDDEEGKEWLFQSIPFTKEAGLFVSSDRDSTSYYMNEALEANGMGVPTLFNECLANLSNEASFSMVVDMQRVSEDPERFRSCLPPYLLGNTALFQPFILSLQVSMNGDHPSHMWVFTYKN